MSTAAPRRVIVVGDVMLDVVVKPSAPVAPTSDTPAAVRVSRGGSAANLAVELANGGHQVVFVGACGDDPARQIFADALADAGVSAMLEIVDGPTGVVVALVSADGQRAMLTDRGMNRQLSSAFVLAQLAAPFDHLHVSGYTLLDGATREAGAVALRTARDTGHSTSVDACSVDPLEKVGATAFLAAASAASMLFANEEEALVLASVTEVHEALEALSNMFDNVVITRGAAGALASSGAARVEVTTQTADVVDTTGAGDAATGAFLGSRMDGESLGAALEQAMAASARVVAGLGARG